MTDKDKARLCRAYAQIVDVAEKIETLKKEVEAMIAKNFSKEDK